ncbi:ethionine resistance protein, partial [Xenotaenia resolanae]
QEALLAAISEKDANIALLELSSSKKKKTQEEVAALKREKDSLVQQLKQQTQNRMKLMADNYEDDHLKVASPNSDQPNNHKPSPDQILSPLLDLNQNCNKLKLYISHLTSLCQERDPIILKDFAPPPAYHRSDSASWHEQLHSMTEEQARVSHFPSSCVAITLTDPVNTHSDSQTDSLQTAVPQFASPSSLFHGNCVCFTSLSLAMLKCSALCKAISVALK